MSPELKSALNGVTGLLLGVWVGVTLANLSQPSEAYVVESVYDGDTFNVRFPGLPEDLQPVSIRVAGIDTPETGHRARCPLEATLGRHARTFTAAALQPGEEVQLELVDWDRYGGRVVAHVTLADGRDLGQSLLDAGLAVAYTGRGQREDWCD